MDQLRAAVERGERAPGGHGGPAGEARPVRSRGQGETLPGQHRAGAVGGGAAEGGAQGPALTRVTTPGTPAPGASW